MLVICWSIEATYLFQQRNNFTLLIYWVELGETLYTKQNADTVMFMDKSARPAAYLFRKTWQLCFPQSDMPEIRFVNIGKEGGEKYESPEALIDLDVWLLRKILIE